MNELDSLWYSTCFGYKKLVHYTINMREAAILTFDKLYIWGRLRLKHARRLSAYPVHVVESVSDDYKF